MSDESLAQNYARGGFTQRLELGRRPALVVIDMVNAYVIEGSPYIVMEYIHGENLSWLLMQQWARGEQMPFDVAACIVRDAALGLDHAHHAVDVGGRPLHVVHRDVTPQTVIVSQQARRVKLIDLGAAADLRVGVNYSPNLSLLDPR